MSDEIYDPQNIVDLYNNGLEGAKYDEGMTNEFLASLPHPLFSQINTLFGDGKGKLSLSWKAAAFFYPKFGEDEAQLVGSCVSHGGRNAADITRASEILDRGEREVFLARGACEPIYGYRGHGGQGMFGHQAAEFLTKVGGLMVRQNYADINVDLTKYNDRLGDGWGRYGLPKGLLEVAKKNQFLNASLVTSVEEARDLVANGYGISVCSNYGFGSSRDKFGIAEANGTWHHCMTLAGIDDTKQRANEMLGLMQNCFSDDTEILTENGWKLFKDISKDEKVATLNIDSREIEYHIPSDYHKYYYKGEMIHFKSRNLDSLVTPNHNMLIESNYSGKLSFLEAEKTTYSDRFIRYADDWNGKRIEQIEIDNHIIDMNDWLEFLGYFLSEGWSSVRSRMRERIRKSGVVSVNLEKDGYTGLSQNEGVVLSKMINILSRLPWRFAEKHNKENNHIQLVNYDIGLAEYMSKFGKAHEKFIPEYVFSLPREQLLILFNAMCDGDGLHKADGSVIGYVTNSSSLADGFQRLCILLGFTADKHLVANAGDENFNTKFNHNFYRVSVLKPLGKPGGGTRVLANRHENVKYDGFVYCVTVKNHTILTRRNGKILWTGQSWGPKWISGPKFEQPEGSFWIRERVLAAMLAQRQSYAFSDFNGFRRRMKWDRIRELYS